MLVHRKEKMANKLAGETSPYLRQHQDNPVDWHPWSDSAILKAQAEGRPIFLSIGYSACHWCHVMAHESFEDPAIAALLNENFICIKVDREERPDLDDIYMQAVQLLTGQGGWPMSVFLTPALEPFYGGTYFPPEPRCGMPSFRQVLLGVAHAWNHSRQDILSSAEKLTGAIKAQFVVEPQDSGSIEWTGILDALHLSYDWQSGGWGSAPKFPPAMLLDLLSQLAWRGESRARKMLEHLLDRMAMGGMYDLVGGGFHRYSVDEQWFIPHFEKMLYDNALLAQAYLHGFAVTGNPRFGQVAQQTLEFIQQELTDPQGGFFASLDADTPQGEGRFYAWNYADLQSMFSPDEFSILERLLSIQPEGNFQHQLNILRFRDPLQIMAEKSGVTTQELLSQLAPVLSLLKSTRAERQTPARDTKIILSWNALAVRALISAGHLMGRQDFIDSARNAVEFILSEMISSSGKLYRIWHEGRASQPGTLSDYAGLILALHALYEVDFSPETYQLMANLYEQLRLRFTPEEGLYYDSAADVEHLLVRPKTLQDNAVPSGNALAAHVHWLFWNYEAQKHDRAILEAMLAAVVDQAQRYPQHFGYWLKVFDLDSQNITQIALATEKDFPSLSPFLAVYRRKYHPYSVITANIPQQDQEIRLPSLLAGKPAVNGQPTAYVCQRFSCQTPTMDSRDFAAQISKP